MRKMFTILTAIALLFMVVASCAQPGRNSATNEITLSESWDFSSGFYPVIPGSDHGSTYYIPNFYETLVNYENGKIVPSLAERWDISDDGRVYTFHLKEHVKFSDGVVFDAEAVKRNLEVIPGALGIYNGSLGTVSTLLDQIIVVDTYTVAMHLKAPYYGTLKDFTMFNPMAMVSPSAFNGDKPAVDVLKTRTLGTGPYMYQGETDGTTYTFVKNPEYWGEEPQIEKFHVKVIPDNDTRLLALRNGELDMIVGTKNISHDGFHEMKMLHGYESVVDDTVSRTRLIAFNVSRAPFDDVSVRQAVSYAIDKESISNSIFSGIETEADGIFDPAMPYSSEQQISYEYDRDKARTLLDRAGWVDTNGDGIREKDGTPLACEFLYVTGNAMIDNLMLVLSAQLKEVGMDMNAKGMERIAYYTEVQQNEFTAAFNETYGITYDPYTFITNMDPELKTDNFVAQGLALVENGHEIISSLNATVDEKKIQEVYRFILGQIHDHAIFLPVSHVKEVAVYNNTKIAAYAFNHYPYFVNVAGITLKGEQY